MEPKLMKVKDYSDGSSLWRVACECGSPNHDVHLWFEPDPDTDYISLNLSMEVGFYNRGYHSDTVWGRILARIRDYRRRAVHAARVLFTGYATLDGDVILDQEGIQAMKLALDKGLDHVKQIEQKSKSKN